MKRTVQQFMTPKPATISESTTCDQAARLMRDKDIGAVLVCDDDGSLCGILTDRDIAVRCVAEGLDPAQETAGAIASRQITGLSPDDDIHDAVELMKRKAIRRIPVMDHGQPIGIVSMGDLAQAMDPESALGQVSQAPPNH